MKELSIEQKAQRYDEAISTAKKFYTPDSNNVNLKADLEMIFPELKDEDERMRKGIIRNLEYLANREEGFVKDDLKEKIAWLEKQGEKKPADKVEPKFHEGDWVTIKE